MRFEKENFYHHFNKKYQTYSNDEIRYKLEVEARNKSQKLTDKKLLKPTK